MLFNSTGGGYTWVNGTNTYTGGTTVRKGVVHIGNNEAFGTGTVSLENATLRVWAQQVVVSNNLVVTGAGNGHILGVFSTAGHIEWSGSINLQTNLYVYKQNVNASGFILSGDISGPGELRLDGGKNVVSITGNNTFSGGTTIWGATAGNSTLQLGSATALGTGFFRVPASTPNFTLDTIGVDLTLTANNELKFETDFAYKGSGGSHLDLGTGNVNISLGAANRTLTISNGVLTIGGTISGTAISRITKKGAGVLVLNGAATYSNTTTVSEGILRGSGSLGGGVDVLSGATLGAGAGGVAAIGTFTAAGAANFNDGSTFAFKLNSDDGTFDQLVANGLTLLGNVTISFSDLGSSAWVGAPTITIIDNTSGTGISGTFYGYGEGATVVIGTNSFTLSYNGGAGGNNVTLTVPEPTTWLLLASTAIFLAFLRYRRYNLEKNYNSNNG